VDLQQISLQQSPQQGTSKRQSATHSLDSFFLTVVPKASSASGTGCPASRSTLISSPARGLSVSPLKNVWARPVPESNSTALFDRKEQASRVWSRTHRALC
jgi:hypothetical protein